MGRGRGRQRRAGRHGLAAFGGVAVSGYDALGGLAVGHIGVGGIFVPVW